MFELNIIDIELTAKDGTIIIVEERQIDIGFSGAVFPKEVAKLQGSDPVSLVHTLNQLVQKDAKQTPLNTAKEFSSREELRDFLRKKYQEENTKF